MVSLKSSHFSTDHCVFFPTDVQILVERLDLCFLTHTKKNLTPIHALIFEKHVKMCVSIRCMKKLITPFAAQIICFFMLYSTSTVSAQTQKLSPYINNWPQWRGLHNTGAASAGNTPFEFSESKNVNF